MLATRALLGMFKKRVPRRMAIEECPRKVIPVVEGKKLDVADIGVNPLDKGRGRRQLNQGLRRVRHPEKVCDIVRSNVIQNLCLAKLVQDNIDAFADGAVIGTADLYRVEVVVDVIASMRGHFLGKSFLSGGITLGDSGVD